MAGARVDADAVAAIGEETVQVWLRWQREGRDNLLLDEMWLYLDFGLLPQPNAAKGRSADPVSSIPPEVLAASMARMNDTRVGASA